MPDYAAFPLIFDAPGPVYAWQLALQSRDPQCAGLPAIHFRGRVAPDVIVVFGPEVLRVRPMLDIFFKDRYRPELFWRDCRRSSPVLGCVDRRRARSPSGGVAGRPCPALE